MRTDGANRCMQYLFIKNKIVRDKVEKYIQYGIASPAGCITECLQRHETPEWRVEKIYYGNNPFLYHTGFVGGVKLIENK